MERYGSEKVEIIGFWRTGSGVEATIMDSCKSTKEELRVAFRVGTGELAIDIGLGVSVEVDPDALAVTHHRDVMPALGCNLGQPGQKSFALIALVDEEPASRGIGPADSEVIALGGFQAIQSAREKIGGHGTTVVGKAVAKPELDTVSISNPFNLGTHAPSFKRIFFGGIGTGSFLELTVESLGCAILGRIVEAPVGDGFGLHDFLGIGIGRAALHRRPRGRWLGRRSYTGEGMESLGILAGK